MLLWHRQSFTIPILLPLQPFHDALPQGTSFVPSLLLIVIMGLLTFVLISTMTLSVVSVVTSLEKPLHLLKKHKEIWL